MRILTTDQARALDRLSMDQYDVPGVDLMESAGRQVAEEAKSLISKIHHPTIIILCGKGNNGGDGFAAATHLNQFKIHIISLVNKNEIKGDAAFFHSRCCELGISIDYESTIPKHSEFDLIIDAILGSGAKGELRGYISRWTEWMNHQHCPILSVDCPTGINGNTGMTSQHAVKSSTTVTMGYSKLGLHLKQGPQYTGKLKVADIGFPNLINELEGLSWSTFDEGDIQNGLIKAHIDTYKHRQGKLLIVAGSKGMTGAAVLSTYGALRSGAGLTITCAPDSIEDIYEKTILEGMTLGCTDKSNGYFIPDSYEDISSKFDWCDVVVIGPGLGDNSQTTELAKEVIFQSPKPLIIDADALKVFDGNLELFNEIRVPFIITPHEGEFCRLLMITREEFQDRFPVIVEKFMSRFPGVLVLKNAPTVTFFREQAVVNTSGNPGMATAGMGDILSGILGTLVGQGSKPFPAAQTGVYLHGLAADHQRKSKGIRGLIASDVLDELPKVFHEIES